MFNLIKPGHILRFATIPTSILSPQGPKTQHDNDNTLETLWPNTRQLGLVQVVSHPAGSIGKIAADVATNVRDGGSLSRSASYSGLGMAVTQSNRIVGSQHCDFVGYTDGRAHYIDSAGAVFSKDFSGCTMVVYMQAGMRRVAHAAASGVPEMNCRHAFMTTIQANGAVLIGWFKPFVAATDVQRKITAYNVVKKYINNVDKLTTFGVVDAANMAYTIDAFKPDGAGYGTNDMVVTYSASRPLNAGWVVP